MKSQQVYLKLSKCITSFISRSLVFISTALTIISMLYPAVSLAESVDSTISKASALEKSAKSLESSSKGILVRNIKISGNKRISEQTILTYLGISLGEYYKPYIIDKAVNKLYATGFLQDIKVTHSDKNTLLVEVIENPTVNLVSFEGNKKIRDKELKGIVQLASRAVYSLNSVNKDITNILAAYQKRGFLSIKIVPKLINLDENRVDVIYVIDEGTKTKINKINFSGNNNFSDKKLKEVIFSEESAWYKILSSADLYDQDRLELDKELLQQHYKAYGYADFNVLNIISEVSPKNDYVILTFIIDEGKIYKVKEVNLEISNIITDISVDELKAQLLVKSNDVFNQGLIDVSLEKLKSYLGKKGYAFANIDYNIVRKKEEGSLDLNFKITEGSKIYINKINIRNNIRTLDKVIRRQLRIQEGDSFNSEFVEISKRRLTNLGYFKSINIVPKETNVPDKLDLDLEVKEMPTGSLNFSVGYNTATGMLGKISAHENNLLGTGRILGIDLEKSGVGKNFNFSFTEPYFLDRDFALGLDLFYSSNKVEYYLDDKSKEDLLAKAKDQKEKDQLDKEFKEPRYSIISKGAAIRGGYSLSDNLIHSVRYTIKSENMKYLDVSVSELLKAQAGKSIISAIGQTIAYDKRNSIMNPTKGYLLKLSQDLAGIGGSARYIKNDFTAKWYIPLYKRSVILNLIARAGYIKGLAGYNLKVIDNFFIGQEYIRGFEPQGIGPRDKKTRDALGGNTYYGGTVEVTFPLGLPKEIDVRGALFTDCYTLYGVDVPSSIAQSYKDGYYDGKYLRLSYGAGVIWESPLGTIRLDYGIPIRKTSYDQVERLRINFGTTF